MNTSFPTLSFSLECAYHDYCDPPYLKKRFGIALGDESYCSLKVARDIQLEAAHQYELHTVLITTLLCDVPSPDWMREEVAQQMRRFKGIEQTFQAQIVKRKQDHALALQQAAHQQAALPPKRK